MPNEDKMSYGHRDGTLFEVEAI